MLRVIAGDAGSSQRRVSCGAWRILSGVLALSLFGCGEESAPGKTRAEIIYGVDGRTEVYEAAALAQVRATQSVAALIANDLIDRHGGLSSAAPLFSESNDVCPGERFATQPTAAFCSGVLIDWDLLLTAGHCVRLYALGDFSIVFGYQYLTPDTSMLGPLQVFEPIDIVSERLDRGGTGLTIDYAILRLARRATPPLRPSPVLRRPEVHVGSPILSIGTPAGLPMKVDAGGQITDPRSPSADYFVAGTDTSKGGSGGPAFDEGGALVGILAGGGVDLVPTDAGCNTMNSVAATDAAEEYTYAARATDALCTISDGSSLCRPACEDPCQALPDEVYTTGGCSISVDTMTRSTRSGAVIGIAAALLVAIAARLRRRGPS